MNVSSYHATELWLCCDPHTMPSVIYASICLSPFLQFDEFESSLSITKPAW